MDLKQTIRNIPDFPKEGILFRDITTLLKDADAYEQLISELADSLKAYDVDIVIGPEARGFVIGSALAYAIHAGFVVARKPGQRVAIVDDLLATGGTALATIKLAEQAGATVVAARFAIELCDLNGRELLKGYDVDSVIKY